MLSALVVLVVDDEIAIADLLQLELIDAGYDVLVANDGDWAKAMLADPKTGIAALVTDVNMGGGPDGWAVARHAREVNSDLPVIYMTGGAAAEWPIHGVPRSVLVPKPFVVSQVITALATLLNTASL